MTRKQATQVCRVTGRMPEWMREYLQDKGIQGEFNLSELTKEQCLALDLAERLCQQEIAGQINVTYDPQKNPEPQAQLTDQAKNALYERQLSYDGEDTNTAS